MGWTGESPGVRTLSSAAPSAAHPGSTAYPPTWGHSKRFIVVNNADIVYHIFTMHEIDSSVILRKWNYELFVLWFTSVSLGFVPGVN